MQESKKGETKIKEKKSGIGWYVVGLMGLLTGILAWLWHPFGDPDEFIWGIEVVVSAILIVIGLVKSSS